MNKNCVAVLALVVASSCDDDNVKKYYIEVLKRGNEVLKSENELLITKEERERNKTLLNETWLEMKRNFVWPFVECWINEDVNKLLSDFGVSVDELFSSYSFSLKKIGGCWKLCWDYGAVNFDLRYKGCKSFLYGLLKSGKKIQGFDDFLKDEKFSRNFFTFLIFLDEEVFFKERVFGDNELEEVLFYDISVFNWLVVNVFVELFRICPNVKVKLGGNCEDLHFDSATFSYKPNEWGSGLCFIIFPSGASFYLRVRNNNELEKIKDFCNEKRGIWVEKS